MTSVLFNTRLFTYLSASYFQKSLAIIRLNKQNMLQHQYLDTFLYFMTPINVALHGDQLQININVYLYFDKDSRVRNP